MRGTYLIRAAIGLAAIAATVLVNPAPAPAAVAQPTPAQAVAALPYPATYGPLLRVYYSRLTPKCLNNPNSSQANGTVMIIYTCASGDHPNQNWYFGPQGGNPYYNIWNSAANKCLTVLNASKADNAPIIQYTCTTGANEEWYPVDQGYSCDSSCHKVYWLVNRNSNKCLTVKNSSAADKTPLLQFTCNDGDNQLWAM